MFDLQADDGSVRKKPFKSPIPGGEKEGAQHVHEDKLDSPDLVKRHHQLMAYYQQELDRQGPNRVERSQDDDFYDNLQWSEDDAATLEERGQKALVYNVLSASVDWVTNTEKRAKSDFKVLPRRKEDAAPAQRKTELLKYLSDANYLQHNRSRAFEDAVKNGLGWLEDGISDDDDNEPLYSRYCDWREMLHDSRGKQFTTDDMRYIFRAKWVDLDVAIGIFPKRAGLLNRSADEAGMFMGVDSYGDDAMDDGEMDANGSSSHTSEYLHGYTRQRVRLIEGWLRIPVMTARLKGGTFNGEIFDALSPGHRDSLAMEEGVKLVEKTVMRMHVAIFTPAGMLWFSESPYRHNKFPYTPIWGKRRSKDGQPYGMIRGLKGIQEDINKRASKALHILSTNKVVMDEDALPEDTDIEVFREEVARPDGIIIKKRGSQLDLNSDRELSQFQLQLMERSIAMVQQSSGVTDELLGRKTNASSGIAIQRRQDQGSMATAHFFENLRLAAQLQGEKQLANIEQFVSEEKAFRITNERGKAEYVKVNDGLPENDIIRTKADFVISDSDWNATMRGAEVDALLDVVGKIGDPKVMLMVLDLIVENMDIKNRDELVKRIRSMSGMKDPDGDEEVTPEEQAKQQAQAKAAQLQERTLVANAEKMEAEAARLREQAKEIAARTAGIGVDAQGKALEVAATALAVDPAVAHTADHILAESRFVSASDEAAATQAVAAAAAAQQPPQISPDAMAAAPGIGAPMPA
jgi:uncharacterized protein (UPF0335 family)